MIGIIHKLRAEVRAQVLLTWLFNKVVLDWGHLSLLSDINATFAPKFLCCHFGQNKLAKFPL